MVYYLIFLKRRVNTLKERSYIIKRELHVRYIMRSFMGFSKKIINIMHLG